MEHFLKHKLILVTIAIQLVALPLVLFAVKERQETRIQASTSTTLSFSPNSTSGAPYSVNLGQEFPVDVVLTPSENLITLAKLEINYDPSKVKLSETNPIVVNSAAFPQIIEGPVYTNGKIQLVVSIGFDRTRVIQTTTKVLTVNFKATGTTNQTQVSFGSNSSLYSLGTGDSSNVSVLSSSTPIHVKINAAPTPTFTPMPTNTPTPSPKPTAIPTPTNIPLSVKVTSPNGGEKFYVGETRKITWTNSPTIDKVNIGYSFGPGSLNWIATNIPNTGSYDWKVGIGNTINTQVKIDITGYHTGVGSVADQSDNFLTVLPKPTSTPTPKPTNAPTAVPTIGTTSILFNGIKLHGLGKGGDTPNPNSTGTINPLRPTRDFTVEVYDTSNKLITSVKGYMKYTVPTEGAFNGIVELPNTIASGEYLITIRTPYYLGKRLQGSLTLIKGQGNTAASATLIAGDVNLDNQLSVLDYDIIMECYSDLQPAKPTCTAAKKLTADISDDGKVNQDDYNLFLREISIQQGE